ncbi:hypothetical protein TELCIR_18925 [Teladorsagia circumcincta]|uniref:Peptidase M12A domain-containing protein n=1 Tax=Teladorsagia circumcincta TaxID=45464 RepID=A0A2G9TNY6_TELCI|nr:hypothetical protein TELCIR_18925 [Teladorsagia circumcincta]
MVSKDVDYMETMGSYIIGFYDLLMMNMYYNCTDACKGVPTRCYNGGFVNPRNCSKCICPSGYGGRFCNRRPPGCGSVHHATRNWKILENKLELNGSKAEPDGFLRCNYWIKVLYEELSRDDAHVEFKHGSCDNIEQIPDDYYVEYYAEETEENGSDKEHKDKDENKLPTGVKLKYRHL